MSADNGDDSLVIIIPFSFLLLPPVLSLCLFRVCIADSEICRLTERGFVVRK